MSKLGDSKFLRLVALAALFFALPALAQFEVAPDHFDSNGKNAGVRKSSGKSTTAFARPAASPAVGRASGATIAQGSERRTRGSNARSARGPLSGRTNAASAAGFDPSRNARRQQQKESNVAKATPTMSQR